MSIVFVIHWWSEIKDPICTPACKELVNEAVLRITYAILEFEAEELVNSS